MPNHKKVIPFRQTVWRFFDYLEGARNLIEDWYQGLSEEGQDKFDALLKLYQKVDSPINWTASKQLSGEPGKHGIWEWRFIDDGKQQRLLGVFGGNKKEAIFLIGCYHKQQIYTPANCLETAIRRAKDVHEGRARLSERTVETNI